MLRTLRRALARIKPAVAHVLQILDWADWKTWVWYSFLGMEQLATAILVWTKRQRTEAEIRVTKRGRFVVVPKR